MVGDEWLAHLMWPLALLIWDHLPRLWRTSNLFESRGLALRIVLEGFHRGYQLRGESVYLVSLLRDGLIHGSSKGLIIGVGTTWWVIWHVPVPSGSSIGGCGHWCTVVPVSIPWGSTAGGKAESLRLGLVDEAFQEWLLEVSDKPHVLRLPKISDPWPVCLS